MITIRSLEIENAQSLSDLHHIVEQPWDPFWSKALYEKLLAQPSIHGMGIFSSDGHTATSIQSFILYTNVGDLIYGHEVEILYIATHPSFQNQGFAKKLLNEIMTIPQLKTIFLDVCIENHKALAFYQKLSFEEMHIRKNYYKGCDGLFYDAKSLIRTCER